MLKYLACIVLASVPLGLLTAQAARTAMSDAQPSDETAAVAAELAKLDALRGRADAAIGGGAADAAAADRLAEVRPLSVPPATPLTDDPPETSESEIDALWAAGRSRAVAALRGQELAKELAAAVGTFDRGDRVAALTDFQREYFGPNAAEWVAGLPEAEALQRTVDSALALAQSEQSYRETLGEAETLFNQGEYADALKALDEADALTVGADLAADRQRAERLRERVEFHQRAMNLPAISGATWDDPAALAVRAAELADFFADFPAAPSSAEADTATFRTLEDRRERVEAARDVHAAVADLTTAASAAADRAAAERFPLDRLMAAVDRLTPTDDAAAYDGPRVGDRVQNWLAQAATMKPSLDYAGRDIQEAQAVGNITLDDTIGSVPKGGWIRGKFTPRGTQGRMDFLPVRPDTEPSDEPADEPAEASGAPRRTDTVHRDSFAVGPRPVATERMIREYNAAWTALFDERQRWRSPSAWSEFARTCRRLQTELEEYRDEGGLEPVGFEVPPAERDLSFAEPTAAAERVVAEWQRIATLLRLGPPREKPEDGTRDTPGDD